MGNGGELGRRWKNRRLALLTGMEDDGDESGRVMMDSQFMGFVDAEADELTLSSG